MPFANVHGVRLRYAVAGEGAPIVFLHGLGSSADDWALQVPIFAARSRVITLDLRAHGQSVYHGSFTIEMMADDVDALLAQLDLPAAHVVGLSLGGCVALALALRHPARVRSLTLVNTFAKYRPPSPHGILHVAHRLWLVTFAPMSAVAAFVAGRLFPRPDQRPLYEAAVASLSRNSKRTYFAAMRAIARFDVRPRLRDIGCPALVLAGDRDLTIPLASKEALQRGLPNAKLLVIPDSGHATPYDQAEAFNRAVLEFIGGH